MRDDSGGVSERQASTLQVHPAAVAAFAALIASGGGLWLRLLHSVDASSGTPPPFGVGPWLRDASLTLPVIALAVWATLLLCRRLLPPGALLSQRAATVALAGTVAFVTSLVLGAAYPLLDLIFAPRDDFFPGVLDQPIVHLPLGIRMLRDVALALAIVLPLALGVAAALARLLWRGPLRIEGAARPALATVPARIPLAGRMRAKTQPRLVLAGALALLLGLPVGLRFVGLGATAAAAVDPGNPCPSGAPIKQFDVQAIDVDIPLNRFGDHDPAGQDVRALRPGQPPSAPRRRSQQVSIGLGDDPIQPLVIRANEGDCVRDHLHQQRHRRQLRHAASTAWRS